MDRQEFYDEMYMHCRCDPGRRQETSLDGHTLHCGKCVICGRYGHFRTMPGIARKFDVGLCEFHYSKLASATELQTTNAFATAKQDPEAAAHLICNRDMGTGYYRNQRNAFFSQKHHYQFYNDLDELVFNRDADTLAKFMKRMPVHLPYDENIKLKQMFVAKRKREYDLYQQQLKFELDLEPEPKPEHDPK